MPDAVSVLSNFGAILYLRRSQPQNSLRTPRKLRENSLPRSYQRRQGSFMPPQPNAVRLIGHKRRFAESIAQIDNELEFSSGAAVASRRDEVVAAARAAYGPSEDFRGVRDAWDAVFPDGVYSAEGLARAKRLA
jgi:hypothetical protein